MLIESLLDNLEAGRNNLEIGEEHYHQWKKSVVTRAFMLDLKIAQAECLNQLSDANPHNVEQIAAWQAVYKQFTDLLEWSPIEDD